MKDDDTVWDDVAFYIAELCCTIIYTVSPDKILIGGGVLKRSILFPKIRQCVAKSLNNYLQIPQVKLNNENNSNDLSNYIVFPANGDQAGIVGSIELARLGLLNNK